MSAKLSFESFTTMILLKYALVNALWCSLEPIMKIKKELKKCRIQETLNLSKFVDNNIDTKNLPNNFAKKGKKKKNGHMSRTVVKPGSSLCGLIPKGF